MQLIKLEERINHVVIINSLEIAKLTGKLHKHVMVDIRNMFGQLDLLVDDFSSVRVVRGKKYAIYNLDKRLALCLTSGYSAKLRLKIIDRVSELESENNFLKARIKSAHDDMELIKVNGSLWGKAGAIQRKQKQEVNSILIDLISQAQMKLF